MLRFKKLQLSDRCFIFLSFYLHTYFMHSYFVSQPIQCILLENWLIYVTPVDKELCIFGEVINCLF